MDRQNQNEERVEVERVEVDMRPVKDAHLPLGVIIQQNGLLKQPTKKESKQLELQKKNTTVKKSNSEKILKQQPQPQQPKPQQPQPQPKPQPQPQAQAQAKPAQPKPQPPPTTNLDTARKTMEEAISKNNQLHEERIRLEEEQRIAREKRDKERQENQARLKEAQEKEAEANDRIPKATLEAEKQAAQAAAQAAKEATEKAAAQARQQEEQAQRAAQEAQMNKTQQEEEMKKEQEAAAAAIATAAALAASAEKQAKEDEKKAIEDKKNAEKAAKQAIENGKKAAAAEKKASEERKNTQKKEGKEANKKKEKEAKDAKELEERKAKEAKKADELAEKERKKKEAEEKKAIKLKELTKKEKKNLEKQEAADEKRYRESFEKNKIIKFNYEGKPQIGVMFSEVINKSDNSWRPDSERDPSKVNVKILGKPDPIEIVRSAITEVIPIKQPKYKLYGSIGFIVNYNKDNKRYRLIDENFSSLDFLGKETIDPNEVQYVYDIKKLAADPGKSMPDIKDLAADPNKPIPDIKDVPENDLSDITPLFKEGDIVHWNEGFTGQYGYQNNDDDYYIGRIKTAISEKNEYRVINNIDISYKIDNVLNHKAYDIFNIEDSDEKNYKYDNALEKFSKSDDKNYTRTIEEKKLSKYGGCPAKSIETFELLYNIKEKKGNKSEMEEMIKKLKNILNNPDNLDKAKFQNCAEFVKRIILIVSVLEGKLQSPSTGGKKKKRTRKMKKRKTLKKRYYPKNKSTLNKKRRGNNKKPRYTTKRRR